MRLPQKRQIAGERATGGAISLVGLCHEDDGGMGLGVEEILGAALRSSRATHTL